MKSIDIFSIEEHAYNAWPAAIVQDLDGWKLRYTFGVTGRANSVWPNHHGGQLTLEEKFEIIERFYRTRNLPPRFMLTEIAQPPGLTETLRTRGYQPTPPIAVQTANSKAIAQRQEGSTPFVIHTAPIWNEAWGNCYLQYVPKTAHEARVRKGIIQRITKPCVFVTALSAQGEAVGVGLGVLDNGWVGIFCMVTAPHARRQGIASVILHAIAQWSATHEADLYLQVHTENPAGLALYTKLGFTTTYQYRHYILQKNI